LSGAPLRVLRWEAEEAAWDMAVSHALLRRVAAGEPPVLRVYRPVPTVAFGRLDALRPGFAAAVAAARARGFDPVLRVAGGHAAAYDGGSVGVDLVTRSAELTAGMQARFEDAAGRFRVGLASLGVDARVGEVPGEYCPGAYSVNARGAVKLVGAAQRVVRGAALMAAVVVVRGGAGIRAVLADVYAALELEWDERTAGAVEDEVPGVGPDAVEAAVRAAYARDFDLVPAALDPATRALARTLVERHRLPGG
jgi:octanoyl-[GcvH]:protein N-octanoyltransferase